MSIQSSLLKFAIKLTPNWLIVWASNIILKGIAELTAFDFDVDDRKLYVQVLLYGEAQAIEVVVDDFAVFHDGESYRFIVHHAHSDRPWLNNLLAKIIGKAWKIPEIPQLAAPLAIVAELFKAKPVALAQADEE